MAGAAGCNGFVGLTNEPGFKYRQATFSAAAAHQHKKVPVSKKQMDTSKRPLTAEFMKTMSV